MQLAGSRPSLFTMHRAMSCALTWGPLCKAMCGQGGEAVWWEDHMVSGLYHRRTPLVKVFT